MTLPKNIQNTSSQIFSCIYCSQSHQIEKQSREHTIPSFMGGSYAPSHFITRNSCKKCNNDLGRFVDAAYAKSWIVVNTLQQLSRKFYRGLNDMFIPLTYIGESQIPGLIIDNDQVPEHWIGPSGETIIWIRHRDDKYQSYSGGNPSQTKKMPSTAFLFLTGENETRWLIGIQSFLRTFKRFKSASKILCCDIRGPSSEELLSYFSEPTSRDKENIKTIRSWITSDQMVEACLTHKINFDQRFIGKMAIGIGYSLFGESYLQTREAKEARRACWPKKNRPSKLRGAATFDRAGPQLIHKQLGYPGAVALTVIQAGKSYVMTLNIDQTIAFTVELGPSAMIPLHFDPTHDYMLLLFPALQKSIELSFEERLLHSCGSYKHSELEMIDERLKQSENFWNSLG